MSTTTKVVIGFVVLIILYVAYTYTRPVTMTPAAGALNNANNNSGNINAGNVSSIITSATTGLSDIIASSMGNGNE